MMDVRDDAVEDSVYACVLRRLQPLGLPTCILRMLPGICLVDRRQMKLENETAGAFYIVIQT